VIKRILSIVFFLSVLIAGLFFLPRLIKDSLVSPFSQGPDQTAKISQKLSPDFVLDTSRAKTLSSLENVPRYLVYNSQTQKVYYAKNAEVRS